MIEKWLLGNLRYFSVLIIPLHHFGIAVYWKRNLSKFEEFLTTDLIVYFPNNSFENGNSKSALVER